MNDDYDGRLTLPDRWNELSTAERSAFLHGMMERIRVAVTALATTALWVDERGRQRRQWVAPELRRMEGDDD